MKQVVLIDPKIEKTLQANILPDLKKGRKNFDLPHTKAVVYWMKWLINNQSDKKKLNAKVLITAAYAHDWGYIGLFDGVDSDDPQIIATRKPMHMTEGAKKISKLLQNQLASHFDLKEISQVAHLVEMHDQVEDLTSEDEIILMEADTLGMLDSDRVKPTFTKKNTMLFVQKEIKQRRLPRFLHQSAKDVSSILIQKRISFYN